MKFLLIIFFSGQLLASDYTLGYSDYLSDTSDNFNGDHRTEMFTSQLPPLSFSYSFIHHEKIKQRADKRSEIKEERKIIDQLTELKARIKHHLNTDEKDFSDEEFLTLYQQLFQTRHINENQLNNFILTNEIDPSDILGKMLISIHICDNIIEKLSQKALKKTLAHGLFMGQDN